MPLGRTRGIFERRRIDRAGRFGKRWGTRLKKIETDPVTQQSETTLYMGAAEFRHWGEGNAEEILLYPTPNIRITKIRDAGGTIVTRVNTLHTDGLGSVRAVTDETGLAAERSTYRPFGEEAEQLLSLSTPKETKGFIGERFDDTSGLQYLNARYYDPKLAMFIQPDWWEVTKQGVRTNRYSYSFNDPVNGKDPSGNFRDHAAERQIARRLMVEAIIEAVVTRSGSIAVGALEVATGPVGLAVAGILSPTAAGDGQSTSPMRSGRVLTTEQVEQGWTVDGEGQIRAPGGRVVVDSQGNFRGLESYSSQRQFDNERQAFNNQAERNQFTRTELARIADERGWKLDKDKTKKAKRDVYRVGKNDFRAVDLQHGQFEHYNKRGEHLGQFDIEGNRTKARKSEYDYDDW